jgi:MHS family proline/betaine transporter-like MFS transporter
MSKFKTAIITSAVNIFEWYDYALFGLFAQIIGDKFFAYNNSATSLLNAFLVFAIGYIVRPIGGIVFGIIGDNFGRKVVLSSTIMCMSIPTFIIGSLPGYETIGIYATIIIVLVRLLQGLAIGGALTGSISFIIEHTEEKYKGLASSLPMSGICIGIMLCSFVSYLVRCYLTELEFNNWGWRVPFLLAIFFMFIGFYIRKYAIETPEFTKNKLQNNVERFPIKKIMLNHKKDIITSIFLNASGSILFYFQVMYIVNYLKTMRNFSALTIDRLVDSTYLIMALAALFGGWLSDRVGRVLTFKIILILIIISILPMINYFTGGNLMQVIIAHMILSILAAIYIGAEPALQCDLYPSNIRNTALSLAYNISTSVFGGTTPYVATMIMQKWQNLQFVALYIITSALLGITALYSYKKIES